jgi:lipoate-protein ligase A
MALDEAIAVCVRRGSAPPTLRLYGWDRPSLSLGCFQDASDINLEYCSAKRIPVVRRPTGGRAILHDKELTYSFSARTVTGPFSKGLLDSYREISIAFNLSFRKLGIHAESKKQREKGRVLAGSPLCFQSSSYGEILIDGKKLVGSAQKRWDDGLLQQGSIPYSHNRKELCSLFGADRCSALRECMSGVKELLPQLDEEVFKETIRDSFEETFGIRFVNALPYQEELSLALDLEEGKYLEPEWNLRSPRSPQPTRLSAGTTRREDR